MSGKIFNHPLSNAPTSPKLASQGKIAGAPDYGVRGQAVPPTRYACSVQAAEAAENFLTLKDTEFFRH
jgi:hypothetical protein